MKKKAKGKKKKKVKGKKIRRKKKSRLPAVIPPVPAPFEKGTELPVTFNEAQRRILKMQTPDHEIFKRKIRGGKTAPYVKGNYVVEQLNQAFGHDWDLLIDHMTDEKTAMDVGQVIVQGRVVVRAGKKTIVKSAFGSSEVKKYATGQNEGQLISLGDDYKAATTDMMKKASSRIGIALDVYRWHGDDGKVEKPAQSAESKEPKDVNARPEDTADQKRVDNKMKILHQTWAQLNKRAPDKYTDVLWKSLWKDYEKEPACKEYPTTESRIDDMTTMLNIDLQGLMKAGGTK